MGNQESRPNSPPPPPPLQAQEAIVENQAYQNNQESSNSTNPHPIPIKSIRSATALVSQSPVAGSPLGPQEQGSSVGSATGWVRNRLLYEKNSILGSSPKKNTDYSLPVGEKDYRNSSKIVHGFGPSGLAPLTPLSNREKKIPIIIVWPHPGKVVHLTGTFNNWKKKIRLQKSTENFSTIVDMPVGMHQFKFIVDDEWKCSEDLPVGSDAEGNLVNCLQVQDEEGKSIHDGLEAITSDYGYETFEPESPRESYTSIIPSIPPKLDLGAASSLQQEGPPSLPVHLQKVILNSKSVPNQDPHILPLPNHVCINHLYACSIRDGVMAIGSTARYRKKYITTVLFKPV